MENKEPLHSEEISKEIHNAELELDELDAVAGGDSLFGDIYKAINDAWTDIKKGVSDGFSGN